MTITHKNLHLMLDMAREALAPGAGVTQFPSDTILLEILGDEALPQLILLVAKASTGFGHEDPVLFHCAEERDYLLVLDTEDGTFVDRISESGAWKHDPKAYPTDFAEMTRLLRLNGHAYEEILPLGAQRKELSETRRLAREKLSEETERLPRSTTAETTQIIRKQKS